MTLEEIKARLSDRNLTTISERTGLSYPTVCAIASGRQKNPSYRTIKKLTDYFAGEQTNGNH